MARFTSADYGATMGWRVGLLDWLDSPNSKVNRYWRSIEYGSDKHVGVMLVGLWDGQAFSRDRNDQRPTISARSDSKSDMMHAARGALAAYFGRGSGPNMSILERYAATKGIKTATGAEHYARGVYFWMMQKTRTIEELPFIRGVISRPIPAGHYYMRAVRSFNPGEEEMKALRVVFGDVLGGTRPGSGAGTRKLRAAAGGAPRTGRSRQFTSDAGQYFGGVGPGVFTFTASAHVQDLTRTSGGGFSKLQSEIRRVNEQVAKRFQDAVVAEMRSSRVRPATGALVRAHADPRNRYPR